MFPLQMEAVVFLIIDVELLHATWTLLDVWRCTFFIVALNVDQGNVIFAFWAGDVLRVVFFPIYVVSQLICKIRTEAALCTFEDAPKMFDFHVTFEEL